MSEISWGYWDGIYYGGCVMFAIFAAVVFFMYGSMALKGYTIIEAADRFRNRHEVGLRVTGRRGPWTMGG